MKPILVSFANRADRQDNLRKAFVFAGIDVSKFVKVAHAKNGKPFLVLDRPTNIGYSLSHSHDIEVIALLDEEREIGIDLEAWPQRGADPVFLETVASAEDDKTLKILGQSGYDAGIALWVLKEAVLKCTGDVKTDPRDLSVSHESQNIFRVRSSATARSPHPEIDVSLQILTNEDKAHSVFLLGVAMSAGALIDGRKFRPIHLEATGWKMAEFGH
jgi:phosphopantetheinyl transferase